MGGEKFAPHFLDKRQKAEGKGRKDFIPSIVHLMSAPEANHLGRMLAINISSETASRNFFSSRHLPFAFSLLL
jgi:hypothetical protein